MRGRTGISYKDGLEEEMITDREMASSLGSGEERAGREAALLRQTGLLAMAAGSRPS